MLMRSSDPKKTLSSFDRDGVGLLLYHVKDRPNNCASCKSRSSIMLLNYSIAQEFRLVVVDSDGSLIRLKSPSKIQGMSWR
jgi:hypothetical protein